VRRRRAGEVVCNCQAYSFPHRLVGGLCKGLDFIVEFFEGNSWGECRNCHCYEFDMGPECQVITGREDFWECPALAAHLDMNEVPVPKKLRRKSWQ